MADLGNLVHGPAGGSETVTMTATVATAGEALPRGAKVKVREGIATSARESDREGERGIVDPYLEQGVKAGEKFYVLINAVPPPVATPQG